MDSIRISFEKAQKSPEERSDFLQELMEYARIYEPFSRYLSNIDYEKHIPRECLDKCVIPIMRTDIPLLARFHKPGSKSAIKIWNRAFSPEVHSRLDEFLSTLFDHEGWHAKEYYERPEIITEYMHEYYIHHSSELSHIAERFPPKQDSKLLILRMQCEIRAYNWQIKRIQDGTRNVSDKLIDALMQERQQFILWLEQCPELVFER